MENKEIVLSVKDLKVNFSTDHGYVQAVRGVSFDLYKGETLCIVGESGSGKSVTSKTIMGILAANGRIVNGSIMYEGEDLTKVSEDEFHRIRGHKIGMIFQDPLSSLNPIVRIGKQITEAMLINSSHLKKMYEDKVADALVAYRNAQNELDSGLKGKLEAIKFLRSERKKDIEKAKNEVSLITQGKLYTLSLNYNGQKILAKDKNKADIEASDDENTKAILKEELKDQLNQYKEQYLIDRKAILVDKATLKEESKNKIANIKADYENRINNAKEEFKQNKKDLKARLKPKIKEAKKAYKLKSKEAHKEVRIYKRDLRKEYSLKFKKEAKGKSLLDRCAIYKENRKEYISKIKITKSEAKQRALQVMSEVGISEPEKRFKQYPFEFSGGMRQRIVIAIALTANPDILICDEPTTALDVTIQAQILELINKLKRERGISCIFITHDLGVVANMADRVAVMYAGKIVEYGTEKEIFYDPKHPYTWALLSSIPDVNSKEKLEAIPGTPPNMIYPPVGDAFALRSKYALAIDFKKEPPYFKVSETHYAATWLLDPRAPKMEMPKIVRTRIENSLKAAKGGEK